MTSPRHALGMQKDQTGCLENVDMRNLPITKAFMERKRNYGKLGERKVQSFEGVWSAVRTRHTEQRRAEAARCQEMMKNGRLTLAQVRTLSNRFQLFLPNGFIKLLQPFVAFMGKQTGSVLNGQAAPNTFRCLCCLLPEEFMLDTENGFAAVVPTWIRPLHETVDDMLTAVMRYVYGSDTDWRGPGGSASGSTSNAYDGMMEKPIARKESIYELPVVRERVKNIRMRGDFWRWANGRAHQMAAFGHLRFVPGPKDADKPLEEMLSYMESIVCARRKNGPRGISSGGSIKRHIRTGCCTVIKRKKI